MAAEVPEVLSRWFWTALVLAALWGPVVIVERWIDAPVDWVTASVTDKFR